jgi:hypothetical protein
VPTLSRIAPAIPSTSSHDRGQPCWPSRAPMRDAIGDIGLLAGYAHGVGDGSSETVRMPIWLVAPWSGSFLPGLLLLDRPRMAEQGARDQGPGGLSRDEPPDETRGSGI